MTSRKLVLLSSAVLCLAAVATTGAIAASSTRASVTTIKAVTKAPGMAINRYIQDNVRWDKDVYKVPSGGTIRIVNLAADEGPHTFTVVLKKDAPRTGLQVVNCKICGSLGTRTDSTSRARAVRSAF